MQRIPISLLLLLAAAFCLGCQVPSYQLPGGFSSTYWRHLHTQEEGVPVAPPHVPSETPCPPSGVFYPQTFQFNPPTESTFQQTVLLPEGRPVGRRRY